MEEIPPLASCVARPFSFFFFCRAELSCSRVFFRLNHSQQATAEQEVLEKRHKKIKEIAGSKTRVVCLFL
jgi:hypothetical protein